MPDRRTFIIVGAGQAGAWVARTLRNEGFDGAILLIGEEQHWPYERPPLSKSVLLGTAAQDEGLLLGENQASALNVTTSLGVKAVRIDRGAQRLHLSNGRAVAYDHLFLTTGSRPRLLPAAAALDPCRVHYLRTREDADRLKAVLAAGERLLVIGGGWIGLEVAASARTLGLEVTVLEAADRVCARSVPAEVSAYLRRIHSAQGVSLMTGVAVEALSMRGAEVQASLSAGGQVFADHLLVAVGAVPNAELADNCGIEIDNGVLVDAAGRTSDPVVFAAGDVTSHHSRQAGRRVRLESWANAQSQAIVAARAALGYEVEYHETPWLWSDQYGRNIQIVGFPERAVTVRVKGEPHDGRGTWLMLDALGAPIGAVAVNDPRELRGVRKAFGAGSPIDLSAWSQVGA